jgi:hypothetical protein
VHEPQLRRGVGREHGAEAAAAGVEFKLGRPGRPYRPGPRIELGVRINKVPTPASIRFAADNGPPTTTSWLVPPPW